MGKRMPCSDELKDEHLDMMLRLAYKYESALNARQALDELEEDGKECSEADARDAYALFLKKYEQQQAQERRQTRRARARRIISRAAEVAACFVLVMAIAAPLAIAKVDAIRVKVMELLVDVKDDHAELSFVEDEDAAFEVPAGWEGLYYPAYIPEGYKFLELDKLFDSAIYTNQTGKFLAFTEYNQNSLVNVDNEGAVVSYGEVNGSDALVLEKNGRIIITWSDSERYFVVEGYITKDEALAMAKSVRRIS